MRFNSNFIIRSLLSLALVHCFPVVAADEDALDLVSAPTAKTDGSRGTKVFLEVALGAATQRYALNDRNVGRVSLDFSHSVQINPGLRGVISNRIDHFNPREMGADSTVNSLREAYVSWQPDGGKTVLEFGRINLRYGPSYGYNPTDFFRDGSLRVLTSADPFALRENRLGTVMLRGQRLWNDGSLSVALSPKLADSASADGWSLDLGSTNKRDRALVALGTQFNERISSQVLVYKESGLSPTLGFNLTALVSDAAVAHFEWTRGSEPDLLSRSLGFPERTSTQNRFVGGLTYTTASKFSITAEYHHNGFAASQADWLSLGAAGTQAQLAYLGDAFRRQDLALREAYLVYITQKSLILKDLDLTAYLRLNPADDSKLAWVELRHRWTNFDLGFRLQQNFGSPLTEFGVLPDNRIVQVLGTFYF